MSTILLEKKNFLKLLCFIIFMSFNVTAHAMTCSHFFLKTDLENRLDSINQRQTEVNILPTLVARTTARIFNFVYNRYDPTRAVQDPLPPKSRDKFQQALQEDFSLSQLSEATRVRIERYIRQGVIEPDYAIEVALYLDGSEMEQEQTEAIKEFINLKAAEKALKKILNYVNANHSNRLSFMRLTEVEVQQIKFFIESEASSLTFIDRHCPLKDIEESLGFGSFIEKFILEGYDDIIRPEMMYIRNLVPSRCS